MLMKKSCVVPFLTMRVISVCVVFMFVKLCGTFLTMWVISVYVVFMFVKLCGTFLTTWVISIYVVFVFVKLCGTFLNHVSNINLCSIHVCQAVWYIFGPSG